MSYVFKRLSEVEALTEVPEGAKVLAEANGKIVRVPGSGLGGGGGIKTAIIKASNYDQALQGVQTLSPAPGVEITYSCINMTFEEAYEAMANGEPMTALMMAAGNGSIFNEYSTVYFLGMSINNVPCIGIDAKLKPLYWTADGLSTTKPVGEQ